MANIPPQRTLWFKARRYGWGWTPITWQGWLTLLIYAAVVFGTSAIVRGSNATDPITLALLTGVVFIATCTLLTICVLKGEKPGWNWGKK